MIHAQVTFLQNGVIPLLYKLDPLRKGKWGKMDGQQMVEHLREICKVANGKIVLSLMNTDPEKLARARAFLLSELPFPENARVPVMPEEPRPHKFSTLEEAITKTAEELQEIFTVYTANPSLVLMHPIFGELNYEEQVQYLYKHIRHHLRQFGLVD